MNELKIKTGYIYLVKNLILDGYKIGITTAPQSRFKQLGVGTKSELVGYWKHDAYRELEKQLHTQFKDLRVPQSEWFDLRADEITAVISQLNSFAEIEFLQPEYGEDIELTGPQYRVIRTTPYEQIEYASWRYFGLLVITAVVSSLLTALAW